jgi:serine/threonine-protein kinase RsbW
MPEGKSPRALQVRTFDGSLEQLAAIREFIGQTVLACGGNAEDIFACELACDEAAANIYRHVFHGKPGRIELGAERQFNTLVIQVHYHGRGFDPSVIPDPDITAPLSERPVGGLGLYFIRQVMSQVEFRFDAENGNTLTMRRKLSQ